MHRFDHSAAIPILAQVVIVEDEPTSRRALAAIMSAKGFQAFAYSSGEDALQGVGDSDRPLVALVDLNLPGMNGMEFIHRLQHQWPRVFPVLISAAGIEELDEACVGSDVAMLRKPLDVNDLLDLLKSRPCAA